MGSDHETSVAPPPLEAASGGKGKRLGHLMVIVPPEAKPGETKITIDAERGMPPLLVAVPHQAAIGDTLWLSSYEGVGWTCSLKKKTRPPIFLPVPATATPGSTMLTADVGDGELVEVLVPSKACPGMDEFELVWDADAGHWTGLFCRGPPVQELAIAAKPSVMRATAIDANSAFSELVAAVTAAGGFVSHKMTRGKAPPLFILGVLAREPVEAGEELARIPHQLHISRDTIERAAPEFWRAVLSAETSIPPSRRAEAAHSYFVGRLLQMAEDRAVIRGDGDAAGAVVEEWWEHVDPHVRKVWGSYMDALLGEDFTYHPLWRAIADRDALRKAMHPSCFAEEMLTEARAIMSMPDIISKECLDNGGLWGQHVDVGMFFRAFLCSLSRRFRTSVPCSNVPVVDLLNHSPADTAGVQWGYDELRHDMVLTAKRAHATGEELLQSYGALNNIFAYRSYGFTQPPNIEPIWAYSLWRHQAPLIFDEFLPGGGTFEILLESTNVPSSLHGLLNDVAKHGGNAAYFLHLVCTSCRTRYEQEARLQPALEAFRSVRARAPTSSAWWTELDNSDSAMLDDDGVRLQMSEYLCLTVHLEAISYAAGEISEDKCILRAAPMRAALKESLLKLQAGPL